MGPLRIPRIWLRSRPPSPLLLRPSTVDDPARQHGKPTPLFLAQTCPQGLGRVSQARISRAPRKITFSTATQTLNEIRRWARLDLLLLELQLASRPVTRGGLKRRPHLLLIRRQPQTRAKGRQTRVQKGGAIFIGHTRPLAGRPLTTIRPPLLRLSLR